MESMFGANHIWSSLSNVCIEANWLWAVEFPGENLGKIRWVQEIILLHIGK